MTDGWNMTGGKVYVAPVGADPKDPSRWHQLGTLTEVATERSTERWHHRGEVLDTITGAPEYTLTTQGPVTLFKPEPVKPLVEFTFTNTLSPELLKLWSRNAGIVDNRGEARKEEKHMGVRKFKAGKAVLEVQRALGVQAKSEGKVDLDLDNGYAGAFGRFEKADVPLIAHALFEKSGWPDAVQEGGCGAYEAEIDGVSGMAWVVENKAEATKALAEAIANLAAYNAWHEGAAEREAAEAAKKAEAEAARKREHDELRTSAIALEALGLYSKTYEAYGRAPFASWDETPDGASSSAVRYWIAKAEAARAAKPVPKVGDRVRVSADAKTTMGGKVYFGKGVEGVVAKDPYGWARDGDIRVSTDDPQAKEREQYVDPKYVTVLATAEDLAAEKAKAERDAGIAALAEVLGTTPGGPIATKGYDRGLRATA